jgi:DNA-binding transcriptional regulator GbsR (MarR family)
VNPPAEWQLEFLEQTGAMADIVGLPPSVIRVFAWLVVCEPSEQSVEDMRGALRLSAGAISAATTILGRMGVCERITMPGERRLYYRMRPGGWERLMRLRLDATAQMRAIADKAIVAAPSPQARLTEMRDLYAWFEQGLTGLVDQFVQRPHT